MAFLRWALLILCSSQSLLGKKNSSESYQIQKTQSFFSMGLQTGLSFSTSIVGRNMKTLGELKHMSFPGGGFGAPFNFFLRFRVYDNLSIDLEGSAKLSTGSFRENPSRISYSMLLHTSGGLKIQYFFEIFHEGSVYRPLVGLGSGVGGNALQLQNRRESDSARYKIYDLLMTPAPYLKFFVGYKFLLGDNGYMDLSFELSRHWSAKAQKDFTEALSLDGNLEVLPAAMSEIDLHPLYESKPFYQFDILVSFGLWL